MSRPTKRFVLPYEPEYTAHRTGSWANRPAARRVTGPALAPGDASNESALDGTLPRNSTRAIELERGGSWAEFGAAGMSSTSR